MSATAAVARRMSATASAKVSGRTWLVLAHLASWFTLLANLAKMILVVSASLCARLLSAASWAEPESAVSNEKTLG